MTGHRIRRWFQFGILDLMILTALVATALGLALPPPATTYHAKPWVFGRWGNEQGSLSLLPGGVYRCSLGEMKKASAGIGWTLSRGGHNNGALILTCGEMRFVVRLDHDSNVMDLLSEDGGVHARLRQEMSAVGPMCDGRPHGTWVWTYLDFRLETMVDYRSGEPVDFRSDGLRRFRRFRQLNQLREASGFPPLTERDFPIEGEPEEKLHD